MSIHPSGGIKVPLQIDIVAFDPDQMMSPIKYAAQALLSGPVYQKSFDVWSVVSAVVGNSYFTKCNDPSSTCLAIGDVSQSSCLDSGSGGSSSGSGGSSSGGSSSGGSSSGGSSQTSSNSWTCTENTGCDSAGFTKSDGTNNNDYGFFWSKSTKTKQDCALECDKYDACVGIEYAPDSGGSYCSYWTANSCSPTHSEWKYYASFAGSTCFKNLAALASVGTTCSADAQCSSGKCNTVCCGDKGKSEGCSQCWNDGDCAACHSNYYLDNGSCVKCAAGKTSASGSQSYSDCAAPKLLIGDVCSADSACSSGTCLDKCCGPKGQAAGCTTCIGNGDCNGCSAGYYIYGYQCVACGSGKTSVAGSTSAAACMTPGKSVGQQCSSNTECTAGLCRTTCCGTKGQTSGCTQCDFSGDCLTCAANHYNNNNACGTSFF